MSESLTEFLLARIAEDEEWAWHPDWCRSVADDQGCDCNGAARVLAECEAKRRVLNAGWLTITERNLTAAFLALPYADHPDYREEWKPRWVSS